MRARSVRAAGAVVIALVTHSLPGQSAEYGYGRKGFYGSVGLGYGREKESCDGCPTRSLDDLTLYIALGGGLGESVRIGGEADGWMHSSIVPTASTMISTYVGFYTVAVAYYPIDAAAFWVKGNLGYVHASSTVGGSGVTESLSQGGLAAGLGIGYDLDVGERGLVVIPYVGYLAQISGGSITVPGAGTVTNVKETLLQFGLGIGYRH